MPLPVHKALKIMNEAMNNIHLTHLSDLDDYLDKLLVHPIAPSDFCYKSRTRLNSNWVTS